MTRIPDLNPAAAPGLRVYGKVRIADQFGNIDGDSDDFSVTVNATTAGRHAMNQSLPADDTWITLWDVSLAGHIPSFVWGRVKGSGGLWYLEVRNAAGDIGTFQVPSGHRFEFPSGNMQENGTTNVSAINRIRARVLTGGTVTNLDGFLVR